MQFFSFIASLPTLTLFEKPEIRTEEFFYYASAWVFGQDMALLKRLSITPFDSPELKRSLLPSGASEAAEHKLLSDYHFFDLCRLSTTPEIAMSFPLGSLARNYTTWELGLRNSMVRIRMKKLSQEFTGCERIDVGIDADAERVALAAYSAANPYQREKLLDRARWDRIEELHRVKRHAYLFDAVCAYRLKLQIAEKWAARAVGNPEGNLDSAAASLKHAYSNQHEK